MNENYLTIALMVIFVLSLIASAGSMLIYQLRKKEILTRRQAMLEKCADIKGVRQQTSR